MTEPVSLADIKAHLRLDPSDTSEDDYLSVMITAARRAVELKINRSVVGTTRTLELDAFPQRPLGVGLLPLIPIVAELYDELDVDLVGGTVASITSVSYVDPDGTAQELIAGDYVADLSQAPARLAPAGAAWPKTRNQPGAVTIVYVISPLPADDLTCVQQAMRLVIGNWYRNREGVQVDARGMPAEIPLTATWLLDPLRQWATS